MDNDAIGQKLFGKDYIDLDEMRGMIEMLDTVEREQIMEEAIKQQKEIQRYIVQEKEKQEDQQYEERQKANLKKKIQQPKEERPAPKIKSPEEIAEERSMVEEYMAKQRSQPGNDVGQVDVDEVEESGSAEEQASEDLRCVSQGHQDRTAVMKLFHHYVLGDIPTLTFCEECSFSFKMVPIMDNNPSEVLLRRLSYLANRLDVRGLYKEADLIDSVISDFTRRTL